jgi:hypothetical protein
MKKEFFLFSPFFAFFIFLNSPKWRKRNVSCFCQNFDNGSKKSENFEKTEETEFPGFVSKQFNHKKESFFPPFFFFSRQESRQKTNSDIFSSSFESRKSRQSSSQERRESNKTSGSSPSLFFEQFGSDQTVKNSSKTMKSRQASSKNSRFGTTIPGETQKQQVVSITYEEIGLFPRSFNRVFDRFLKQVFFDVENFVIQEYRFYRYLFFTTVKCLCILFFLPFTVNFLAKTYCIRPITEYFWNTQNHEIFLNSYQQKQAFSEFKNFEEKMYFESFLFSDTSFMHDFFQEKSLGSPHLTKVSVSESSPSFPKNDFGGTGDFEKKEALSLNFAQKYQKSLQKRLQTKILEVANHYNEESIEAVTNFFADILSFATLWFLLVRLEIQINITKSFLLEVFFGLDDSKKSLLILFFTDLLVGYHSPNIWELFFQTLFDHYGLPESQTTIFLLVATLPVLLDVLFKYLIFRHLNRASPATVATYHAMIE